MNEPRSGQEEMDAVLAELDQLDQQGAHDLQATQRLRARMDAAMKRLEAESQARRNRFQVEIDAIGNPRLPPLWFRIAVLSTVLAVATGAWLESSSVGESFIFAASGRYRAAVPWLVVVLMPLVAYGLHAIGRRTGAGLFPGRGVVMRWLGSALVFALGALGIAVAPLGYLAAYGRQAGTPVQDLEATLVSLDAPRRSLFSCKQSGRVEWQGEQARLCLSSLVVGPMPHARDRLRLAGLQSAAGLYVQRIEKR